MGHCPYCAGTDIFDTMDGRRGCLDCDKLWGGKKPKSAKPKSGMKIYRVLKDMGE